MNRIILIGNGFDLAHGLPTSYEDFIKDFWKKTIDNIDKSEFGYSDDFVLFRSDFINGGLEDLDSVTEYTYAGIKSITNQTCIIFEIQNELLSTIVTRLSDQKWVDIENEYYSYLKKICLSDLAKDYNIDELHGDFNKIKKSLEEYLNSVEDKPIDQAIIGKIARKIFSVISIQDLSNSYINDFIKDLRSKIENFDWSKFNNLNLRNSGFAHLDISEVDVQRFLDNYIPFSGSDEMIKIIRSRKVSDNFLIPDSVLFLNFNYTKTHNNYLFNNISIESNHIHGKLKDENNPIIFGYGDELEESYKAIENLNDNKYLENVKSIKYLETDNYRRLLSFIDSDPFQIYVMGHSCGNSDRTLLNKMFEHKNCVSIKPYYYQYGQNPEDNNYSDIIRNISRNFTDKSLMRERVVNKAYCEPLLDYKPKSKK